MGRQRKIYSAELKARVAVEAIKGQMTVNQIATRYDVDPNLIAQWKQQALRQMPELFARPLGTGR
jgi:transposase-like protein